MISHWRVYQEEKSDHFVVDAYHLNCLLQVTDSSSRDLLLRPVANIFEKADRNNEQVQKCRSSRAFVQFKDCFKLQRPF